VGQPHEAACIGIRQWLEQNPVDQAEHRGRRADAERQHHSRRTCEGRRSAQATRREAKL